MFGFLKEKLKKFFKKESAEISREVKEEKIVEQGKEKLKEKFEELKEETRYEKKEELKEEIQEIREDMEEKFEKVEEKEEKKGFFAKLKGIFSSFKLGEEKFEEMWQELEILLIESNVAISAIDSLKSRLRTELVSREIKKSDLEKVIKSSLKDAISHLLLEPFDFIEKIKNRLDEKRPFVIVFFGINGSGKTTSIAKIAHLLKKSGLSCVLAAGDTFRAASIEQLTKHANKLNIPIIKQNYQADPAAVAFDAIAHAKSNEIDVVLIDTAGRMQNQTNLMREMEKIIRVSKPDLKIFVGESITGNDVVEQARAFNSSVGVDGIILSKADVDEKGGAALSVSYVISKPILFLGIGQEYDDLEVFNKEKLLNNIFD